MSPGTELFLFLFQTPSPQPAKRFCSRLQELFGSGKHIDIQAIAAILFQSAVYLPFASVTPDLVDGSVFKRIAQTNGTLHPIGINIIHHLVKDYTCEDADDFLRIGHFWYDGTTLLPQCTDAALRNFQRASSKSQASGEAYVYIGLCYMRKVGTEVEWNGIAVLAEWVAVKHFKMAAKLGNSKGMYYVAKAYRQGLGIGVDEVEALRCLRSASELGLNIASQELAKHHHSKGGSADLEAAYMIYQQSAERGHAESQYHLGMMHENGISVDCDIKEAIAWYHLAAEQNHTNAQFSLGFLLEHNLNLIERKSIVGTDNANCIIEAAKWYKAAAEKGHASAQNHFGLCLKFGRGIECDYKAAFGWFTLSAENGTFCNNKGDPYGQNHLAQCYQLGQGTNIHPEKAVYYYKQSKTPSAHNNLGLCYEQGFGCKQSSTKALALYFKAANANDTSAQFNLGDYYDRGEGDNICLAKEWYAKAAEKNDYEAQKRLLELSDN